MAFKYSFPLLFKKRFFLNKELSRTASQQLQLSLFWDFFALTLSQNVFTLAWSYIVRIDWLFWLTLFIFATLFSFQMLNLAELNHLSRLELAQWYFLKRFSYKEITMLLSNKHGIDISLRQLHRPLRQQNLYRKYHKNTVNVVLEAIKAGIDRTLTNLGYCSIHQKLRHNGIKTDRETIRLCLKTIDSEGVERRKDHKFKRRVYVSQEPNFMWHIDGFTTGLKRDQTCFCFWILF